MPLKVAYFTTRSKIFSPANLPKTSPKSAQILYSVPWKWLTAGLLCIDFGSSQLDSSQGVCPRAISNEFLSPSLSVRPTIMKSSHLALDTRQTHAFKHDHRHCCCCAMLCHSYVTTTTMNHQVTYLMYEAPQRIVLTTFQLLTDMDNLHRISNYTAELE